MKRKWLRVLLVIVGLTGNGCVDNASVPPVASPSPSPSPSPSVAPTPYLCGCCFGMHMLPGAKCEECGAATAFQEHKLCDACSARLVQCAHCRKAR